jgi:hypothetical protein
MAATAAIPPAPTASNPGSPYPVTLGTLTVVPWVDPVIDKIGYDPRSVYAEQFWLSIIGPSALWLLRRLADGFDTWPDGFDIDLPELAQSLGLSFNGGDKSIFVRTLIRVEQFGLAHRTAQAVLLVRRRLPSLTRRQTERLPHSLRIAHAEWMRHELDQIEPLSAAC